MSNSSINPKKIVVFSGSGLSAPSGIATFRSANGLWNQYRLEDVATPQAWMRQPQLVLDFYNERRAKAAGSKPNAGHKAIVDLEREFEVVVVTQNVDDLHERAGSSQVIHLHGELRKARSTSDPAKTYEIGGSSIQLGDLCEAGSQLRPHIVWFGEQIMNHEVAEGHIREAGRVIVVGTSLVVYPAAGLVKYAARGAMKVIVDVEIPDHPRGFEALEGSAEVILPQLVERWLS